MNKLDIFILQEKRKILDTMDVAKSSRNLNITLSLIFGSLTCYLLGEVDKLQMSNEILLSSLAFISSIGTGYFTYKFSKNSLDSFYLINYLNQELKNLKNLKR